MKTTKNFIITKKDANLGRLSGSSPISLSTPSIFRTTVTINVAINAIIGYRHPIITVTNVKNAQVRMV